MLLPGFVRRVRVLSYGGGLDSFAMLVDAIARGELPDLCVFADVGDPEREDPGEWPETYRHVREVAMPLAQAHGIEFVWLDSTMEPVRGQRSLWAYYRHTTSMPGRQSRMCTSAAKVDRIRRYLKRRFPSDQLEVWIGFEAGEEERVERDPHAKGQGWRVSRFPLVEQGICRCRAEALVRAAGHPVPPKSACVFCPFGTRGDFARLRAELPGTFARLEDLERGAKLTRAGAAIRFSGGASMLDAWTTGSRPYLPMVRTCRVCGGTKSKPAAPPDPRMPVLWERRWDLHTVKGDGWGFIDSRVRRLRGTTPDGRKVLVTVSDGDSAGSKFSRSCLVRVDGREELAEQGKRAAEAHVKSKPAASSCGGMEE